SKRPLPLFACVPHKVQERVVAPADGEALSLKIAPVEFVSARGEVHLAVVESKCVFSFLSGLAVNKAVRLDRLAATFVIFDAKRILRHDEDLAPFLQDVIT